MWSLKQKFGRLGEGKEVGEKEEGGRPKQGQKETTSNVNQPCKVREGRKEEWTQKRKPPKRGVGGPKGEVEMVRRTESLVDPWEEGRKGGSTS